MVILNVEIDEKTTKYIYENQIAYKKSIQSALINDPFQMYVFSDFNIIVSNEGNDKWISKKKKKKKKKHLKYTEKEVG